MREPGIRPGFWITIAAAIVILALILLRKWEWAMVVLIALIVFRRLPFIRLP